MLSRDGDDDAVAAGRAENLGATVARGAFHVLAAVDAGEFEICIHGLLSFGFCRVMRNSVPESINELFALHTP